MIEDLIAAIVANPDDWDRYAVLADFLEESGQWPGWAPTLRWMREHRKRPHRFGDDLPADRKTNKFPWVRTSEDGLPDALPYAGLPDAVRGRMKFYEWRAYETWVEAVNALALALVPPITAEMLKGLADAVDAKSAVRLDGGGRSA